MTLRPRIENDFTYHPPTDGQPALYQAIRDEAKQLALFIDSVVPEGREKALALTNLEQAVFWANAGIARSPEPNDAGYTNASPQGCGGNCRCGRN